MNSKRTDNSRTADKINLRERLCKDKGTTVLDCYHGEGVLWGEIKKRKACMVIGIEKERGKGSGALYGEAEKIIPSLDLGIYDIIDCDSWGQPYRTIRAIFRNETLKQGTVIIYTFIRTGLGSVNREMLGGIGITKEMYRKCHTLFRDLGFIAFKEYIRKNGIDKIYDIEYTDGPSNKHYGYFVVQNEKPCYTKTNPVTGEKEAQDEHNLRTKRKGKRVLSTGG